MTDDLKRISLVIREEQHDTLHKMGVNISGFIRDLIDDRLSDYTIQIAVSEETSELYNKVISNTGSSDENLEVYLKEALRKMLEDKIKEMQQLHKDFS